MGAQHDAERFQPGSLEEWSAWLAEHHATSDGVWLVTAKKSSGLNVLEYEDCVIEAVWDSFTPSVRKGMLAWVAMAKRPGTRAKRVSAIAEHAGRGERAIG